MVKRSPDQGVTTAKSLRIWKFALEQVEQREHGRW